ncbi:hypothetical protein Dimus_007781 [Dionaea muscipula]
MGLAGVEVKWSDPRMSPLPTRPELLTSEPDMKRLSKDSCSPTRVSAARRGRRSTARTTSPLLVILSHCLHGEELGAHRMETRAPCSRCGCSPTARRSSLPAVKEDEGTAIALLSHAHARRRQPHAPLLAHGERLEEAGCVRDGCPLERCPLLAEGGLQCSPERTPRCAATRTREGARCSRASAARSEVHCPPWGRAGARQSQLTAREEDWLKRVGGSHTW